MSKTKNAKFKWRKLLFAATAAATPTAITAVPNFIVLSELINIIKNTSRLFLKVCPVIRESSHNYLIKINGSVKIHFVIYLQFRFHNF